LAAVVTIAVCGRNEAAAQTPSGEAVYKQRCATCHDQTSQRIPPRDALQKMPSARIVRALDSGAMMAVAFTMSQAERQAVARYLGTSDPVTGPPPAAFCADRSIRLNNVPAAWTGWSPGTNNARFQSADAAKLKAEQVPGLKLKWAFGFDGDVTAFAPPTIIGDHVFVGSAGGVVHAMRADSGCLKWTFQANGPVRAGILAVQSNGGYSLLFGDMAGWFYSLQADTGKLLWKLHVEEHDSTRLTAAATARGDVVYVPVASWEETRTRDQDYPCCTFRGSVVALRVSDGKRLWQTYLVDEPKERGKTQRNVPRFGPSGVAVWSTPTLDPKRGLLYVTTGDNYSSPATELSDAVVALSMDSGRIVWSKQVTKEDVFNGQCGSGGTNCPATLGPDFDFGSPAVLTTLPNGRDLLLAGQKSGVVFAFDPDKRGEILWETRVGKGGTGGGIQWGIAADGQNVYAAVADYGRTAQNNPLDPRRYAVDPREGGGLTALRIDDGKQQWYATPTACREGAPSGCSPAQPAAVTAIPGVVFSAAYDGHLRAYSTATGAVLWDFDTMREFDTVNGIKGHGGSIDGPGPVVANGMVFITSGYPRNGGVPGNVLLAFAP
jgi:polyvinyl alcohol dehydrogenase (cytochrome)